MKITFDNIKTRSKKISKEIYYFISSGIFLKNFGGIVAVIALFLMLTFWWMNCYTRHGQALHVHDFIEMNIEDAIDKAQKSNFEIVINDSTFIPRKAAGVILTQSPKPASLVKKDRKIYVSITKVIPDMTTLPNLKGGNEDYDNFRKKCKRSYVEVEILRQEFSNKLEPSTILEVFYLGEDITNQLNEGFEIPKGDTLQCVITKRGGGSVPVPELVCKKYEEAEFLVGNFNLNIGSVIKDRTVTDESTAYVWRQVPRFNGTSRMRVGEQIDIYITQFKPSSCADEAGNIEALPDDSESEEFD